MAVEEEIEKLTNSSLQINFGQLIPNRRRNGRLSKI